MEKVEIFFDYACPYCMRAHEYLKELHTEMPHLKIAWRPCESHPRPERYGPHSDLCIRGMFYAQDKGANLWEYHERMYSAALRERLDVEDADVLAACVRGLLDGQDLKNALLSGAYIHELEQANSYAYGRNGVWVVPAYRTGNRHLDAVEDVGVTKRQIEAFLNGKDTQGGFGTHISGK